MEKNKLLPYDLESYPLHLKTSSKLGSLKNLTVGFTSTGHTGHYFTFFQLHLSFPPTVLLKGCLNATEINLPISNISDRGQDMWILRKSRVTLELLLDTETVFILNFTKKGGKCEEIGLQNVIWLFFAGNVNDAVNLQFRPQIRGTGYCRLRQSENQYIFHLKKPQISNT